MGESVLTATFGRTGGLLVCEGVPLRDVAREAGTPTYVYSASSVREQYSRLTAVLAGVPYRIHYSCKANSNLALLGVLRSVGAGADVVSGGELHRALAAGFSGRDVVFGGVGKTEHELDDAVAAGVLLVNVESEAELRLLDEVARRRGVVAPVALRVNPEVTVETPHAYTRTGEKGHKFGIPYDDALDVAEVATSLPNVTLAGLDMHVGSQLSRLDAYEQGVARMRELWLALGRRGLTSTLRHLDLGGGLAVPYGEESHTDLEAFAAIIVPFVRETGLSLILEPGRFLVGNAGVLLTRVLYRKRSGGREIVVTDAGMNDLLRPSHYNAFHRVEAVEPSGRASRLDVVGPVCESGDFLALDREMDDVEPGDLIAVHSAGAYGFSMASNYNSRPRPAEVLIDGGRWAVVTRRESYEDLIRNERIVPEWRSA